MRRILGKEFGFYLDERLDNSQGVLLVHFTQEPNHAEACLPSGYAMQRPGTKPPQSCVNERPLLGSYIELSNGRKVSEWRSKSPC